MAAWYDESSQNELKQIQMKSDEGEITLSFNQKFVCS